MKKSFIAIVCIVILITITILILIQTQYYGKIKKTDNNIDSESMPKRFVCIYSGSSDYYKYALKEGLDKASKELNVWVKFYEFKPLETEKHFGAFDMAIASKVDGIITNVPVNDKIQSYINEANGKGIPVVTIESDLPESKRVSFVGTNNFEYGSKAGKLMIEANKEKSRIAVFNNTKTTKIDMKNQGFQSAINKFPQLSTEMFTTDESSVMGFTNVAQAILINNTEVNAFFCNDAESTMGVVRSMIEFNKTNNIVIGSGDSDEILKYIKNGMIYASLVEDPHSIGYLSVSNILKFKKGESISQIVNPDIIIITKDNIDKMLAERKVRK